jgi:hypothetical protein
MPARIGPKLLLRTDLGPCVKEYSPQSVLIDLLFEHKKRDAEE